MSRKPKHSPKGAVTFHTRERCPVCNKLNCALWRTLESHAYEPDERIKLLERFHLKKCDASDCRDFAVNDDGICEACGEIHETLRRPSKLLHNAAPS